MRGLVFECPPSACVIQTRPDIDQFATSVDHLMSYLYQPILSQKEKHLICETEVRCGGALLIDEQLQRPTSFPAETMSSRVRRHLCPPGETTARECREKANRGLPPLSAQTGGTLPRPDVRVNLNTFCGRLPTVAKITHVISNLIYRV
jgi:hypothetical protein